MLPEDRIRLQHIVTEIQEACSFAEGMTFEEFVCDRKTVKAIIRSIEVIGEAAARISGSTRVKHSNIPWKQIVGMRNHLIHVYFDTDYMTVWKTVKDNLPPLLKQLEMIIIDDP